MTVGEYSMKFESLLKYSEFYQLHSREEWMCRRFQDGLRFDIQRSVMPLGLERFSDLVEKSMQLESFDRRRDQQRSGGPLRTGSADRGNFQRGAL